MIVEAVVNMASACRMSTTAEGVETVTQREILRGLGWSEMQGYLFSPAVPRQSCSSCFYPKHPTLPDCFGQTKNPAALDGVKFDRGVRTHKRVVKPIYD